VKITKLNICKKNLISDKDLTQLIREALEIKKINKYCLTVYDEFSNYNKTNFNVYIYLDLLIDFFG